MKELIDFSSLDEAFGLPMSEPVLIDWDECCIVTDEAEPWNKGKVGVQEGLRGEDNPAKRPEVRERIAGTLREYYKTTPFTEAQDRGRRHGKGGKKGRVQPPEEKAKQIAAQTGKKRKPHSEATKQKMREAALRRYGKL